MKHLGNITNNTLEKWEIIRVYDSVNPNVAHDKFCICVCPVRRWFLFINSEPPQFRKKKEYAIEVANHEVVCLVKPVSYIDTTTIIRNLDDVEVDKSIADSSKKHGILMPTIQQKIRDYVTSHGVFNEEEILIILND